MCGLFFSAFFSFSFEEGSGLSFFLARSGSCIPRALVDSRSPHSVLTAKKKKKKKRLQIPGSSANDNTVTGPQRRLNTYLGVGLAVYKTCIPARSLKEEFGLFFSVFILQMFFDFFFSFAFSFYFLPGSCFLSLGLGGGRKPLSAS